MRPDQQQADGVLAVLDKYTAPELGRARDAVAEYIAANDELIAAGIEFDANAAYEAYGVEVPRRICERMQAAQTRYHAAHARMKGEAK